MQLFRTLCVVAVLGALTYGAYVTLTSSPPVEPPPDAVNFGSVPRIELPGDPGPGGAATAGTSLSPPGSAAPKFGTDATSAGGASSPGATITGIRPQAAPTSEPPPSYPNTNIRPGPYDGGPSLTAAGLSMPAATPLRNDPPTGAAPPTGPAFPSNNGPTNNAASPSNSALPGNSISSVSPGGTNSTLAPPLTPVTPVGALSPNGGPPAASMIPATPGIAAPGVASTSAAAAPLAEAQTLLNQNQLAKALDRLSASFENPALTADDDRRVNDLLDQLAGTVIYSREHLLEPPYTVIPGDRLDQIAAKYQVPWELLAKINGIADPMNLTPGTQLKVVRGPFDGLIDKSRRRLTLFLDGMYAGSFPVGFGRDRPPVDGEYQVGAKVANPAYAGPDLQLSADDPNNPLGERLIDLGQGQVLHGTSEPANLTSDDARGCIRMAARDIEDVYDILTPGSRVIVRP